MTVDSQNPPSRSGFRLWIAVTAVVLAIAAAYLAYVFGSRAYENSQIEQRAEQQAASQKHAQDQKIFENLGGDRFDILRFYAYPATIHAGDEANLCYGVSNAKSVSLKPAAKDPVWPAFNRCVEVEPKKTTTFTLTASDSSGHPKSSTVTVVVR
jgi:hypothetical protein